LRRVFSDIDKRMTLREVAEHVHLHARDSSRWFTKHTNMNYVEYVVLMSKEEARKLVDPTSDRVDSIADKFGLESNSYFLKVSKKYYGTSPVKYRQGVRIE